MHQVRYKGTVSYTDFDNQIYSVPYELFANDKADAEKIVRELFFMSYGTYSDMKILIRPKECTQEEQFHVFRKVSETFGVVSKQFINKTYKDFLKLFENFDGYDLVLRQNYASFWFKFMAIECKAVWKDGEAYLSEEEVLLYRGDGRVYVVRNNFVDVFLAY